MSQNQTPNCIGYIHLRNNVTVTLQLELQALLPEYLWVANPGGVQPGPLQDRKVSGRAHLGRVRCQAQEATGSLQRLTGTRLSASVSCWLSAYSCSQLLAVGPGHMAPENMAPCSLRASKE